MREVFCLIKTHAAKGWSRIVLALHAAGITSNEVAVKKSAPPGLMEAIYGEHAGKTYYERLLESVAGEVVFITAHVTDLSKAREALGPADPAAARREAPTSVRAVFGGDALPHNAVHLSDSFEAGARELALCRDAGVLGGPASWLKKPGAV